MTDNIATVPAPLTANLSPAILENGAPRNPASAVWHSRGYLPHFEGSEFTQHVTFHLADSLPHTALQAVEAELKTIPVAEQAAQRRKRLDAWIDAGHGSCLLRNPSIATMVQQSLITFDAQRYRLLAWVVMPNHVHALFQPLGTWPVAKIVASWKKFTAHKIREHFKGRAGQPALPIWQREYWDRYIRNQTHLVRAIEYIHSNPVKTGLVPTPADWPWSSAHRGTANSAPSRAFGGMNLQIGESEIPTAPDRATGS